MIPIAGAPRGRCARRRVEAVPEGHLFLLGDNAGGFHRQPQLGPVPDPGVVGRVLFGHPEATPRTTNQTFGGW